LTPLIPGLLICALALLGSPLARAQAAGLSAAEPVARRMAIYALVEEGGAPSVEALTAYLERESDPALRRAAQDALMRIPLGDEDLLALLSSPHDATRAFAAHGLGRRRGAASASGLLDAIRDPSPTVRREVYEGLAVLGNRVAIPELVRAAVRESSPPLRDVAEQAARRLADLRSPPEDVPAAIALLEEGNPDDQRWAAKLLGRSSDWRALDALLQASGAASQDLRHEAIKSLGLLGDKRAVPHLLGMLEQSAGKTRHHVIGALALLADETSAEPLEALLRDPDPGTRCLALRALARLGLPGTGEALEPSLSDDEEVVRAEAIHALARLEEPAADAAMAAALNDPSPFIRAEAARLLAGRGAASSVERLLPLLDDRDILVRLTAADGLADLGAMQAIPALRALADRARKDEERQAYEEALKRLEGE